MSTELIDALRDASETDDPDARRAIYRAFARAEVLVPTDGEQMIGAEAADGSAVGLAFTDTDALANWAEGDCRWGALRGSDLCALVLERGGSAVIVNPHGPYGGQLGRRELELVADGGAFDVERIDEDGLSLVVSDPSQIQLRAATTVPDRILEAATDAAAEVDGVTAVYVLEVVGPSRTHLALGLELADDATWSEVAPDLAGRLARTLPPDDYLDLYPLSPEQLAAVRESSVPAFHR